MNRPSDPLSVVFRELDAVAEGRKFPYVFPGFEPAFTLTTQRRLPIWNQPHWPVKLYTVIGTGIVRSGVKVTYPDVLQFAHIDLEVERHGFCMQATREVMYRELLEDRYGLDAIKDGAPFTAIIIQAI